MKHIDIYCIPITYAANNNVYKISFVLIPISIVRVYDTSMTSVIIDKHTKYMLLTYILNEHLNLFK